MRRAGWMSEQVQKEQTKLSTTRPAPLCPRPTRPRGTLSVATWKRKIILIRGIWPIFTAQSDQSASTLPTELKEEEVRCPPPRRNRKITVWSTAAVEVMCTVNKKLRNWVRVNSCCRSTARRWRLCAGGLLHGSILLWVGVLTGYNGIWYSLHGWLFFTILNRYRIISLAAMLLTQTMCEGKLKVGYKLHGAPFRAISLRFNETFVEHN